MFLTVLSFLLFSQVTRASVSDCSRGALFKLTSMSFMPDPPIKGQNSTLFLSMNVPSAVTGGTATYTVTYNYIPLTPTTDNLCTVVPAGCPIMPGTLDTVSSIPFDGSLSGLLNLKIEWKDLAAKQLMCVFVKTTV